jgi:hypothetical protein
VGLSNSDEDDTLGDDEHIEKEGGSGRLARKIRLQKLKKTRTTGIIYKTLLNSRQISAPRSRLNLADNSKERKQSYCLLAKILNSDGDNSQVPTVRMKLATVNAVCASPPLAVHAIPTIVATTHGIDPMSPMRKPLQSSTNSNA